MNVKCNEIGSCSCQTYRETMLNKNLYEFPCSAAQPMAHVCMNVQKTTFYTD